MPKFDIPTPLRPYTEQQSSVEVAGETVKDCLSSLIARYPQLQKHLYDSKGKIRSFVNIYLGDEDIRFLDKEDTEVEEGDSLTIVPSIAGGCHV